MAPYAILSLGCFICAIGVLFVLLRNADQLHALGLVGIFYYVVLIPLGLAAAGFLFGALRSYAIYTGRQFGGRLELGGPIIAAALVVIGGVFLPKPVEEPFDLTVFVHGEAGAHDLVLRDSGSVQITLGNDLREEKIGAKGQAVFPGIPSQFRRQVVPVSVDAAGFEPAAPHAVYRLDQNTLDVTVRHQSEHYSGRVQDAAGKPIASATVSLGQAHVPVDGSGHFTLTIPGLPSATDRVLTVEAPDFQPWRNLVVPDSNEIVATLSHLSAP